MKVIKGRFGKSKALHQLLSEVKDKNILIIDNHNVPHLHSNNNNIYLCLIDFSEEELLNVFDNHKQLHEYPVIAFYLNTKEDLVTRFKELEERYGFESFITIQSHANENGEVVIYEI